MVDNTVGLITNDDDLYAAWLGPVDDAIKAALKKAKADPERDDDDALSDLQDALAVLSKKVPDIYEQMDTSDLEEYITAAMFSADANARIEKAGALPKDTVSLADDDFLVEPSTFTGARDYFQKKATLPTNLSSRAISLLTDEAAKLKDQAFFSARVSSANILGSLRGEIDEIIDGKRGYSESITRMKEFLAREGYGIPAPGTKEERNLQDIASTHRLELILRQNVAMAHAVGQRKVSEHPAVIERFPNYRYIANTNRHAQYDGLVLPKGHPFWKTHYPPWDFNCKCLVVDEDGPANAKGSSFQDTPEGGQIGKLSKKGQTINVMPAESGFVFNSSPQEAFQEFDHRAVEEPDLRRIFKGELEEREAKKEAVEEETEEPKKKTKTTTEKLREKREREAKETEELRKELQKKKASNAKLRRELLELEKGAGAEDLEKLRKKIKELEEQTKKVERETKKIDRFNTRRERSE